MLGSGITANPFIAEEVYQFHEFKLQQAKQLYETQKPSDPNVFRNHVKNSMGKPILKDRNNRLIQN